MSQPTPTRLRLRVAPAAETAIRRGHPWVFRDRIQEQNRDGAPGEIAVVYDRKDRFLALGLYDPLSPIGLRVLHTGKPSAIDAAWWQARLRATLDRRREGRPADTDGLRLINGESDGWPALVLDQYGGTLVLKIYSSIWLLRISEITAWILQEAKPDRLVLRWSRNVAAEFERAGFRDGQNLHGTETAGSVIFRENGIQFWADVVKGQKTGFFLDQRENRRLIGTLSSGATVLNAFSFSGGFSLYAARGGASTVTDLDISPHALESARANFALNQTDPAIRAAQHESVQADCFEWLEKAHRNFDIVICDPPSLARRELERAGAIQAYGRLAENSLRRVRRGGWLLAASCSAHVSAEEFFGAVLTAVRRSGQSFTEWRRTHHAPDHPATFPEAHYLKAIYLKST
jgi:23S rRNA (cytosine1962-C5)-methyltransferase